MDEKKLEENWNQLIIRGIAASAATAVEAAQRYNTSLVIWRDGKIVEVPPEEFKLQKDKS